MPRIIECVPNFSEGRNKEVIEAIANAIASTEGCNLLDVDPGASTNRTVYTFVGTPEAIVEGALNGARVAYQAIDMRRHKGEHPRMGALDVCPFIPVQNVSMEECVECAKEFGEKLALELGVPGISGSIGNLVDVDLFLFDAEVDQVIKRLLHYLMET